MGDVWVRSPSKRYRRGVSGFLNSAQGLYLLPYLQGTGPVPDAPINKMLDACGTPEPKTRRNLYFAYPGKKTGQGDRSLGLAGKPGHWKKRRNFEDMASQAARSQVLFIRRVLPFHLADPSLDIHCLPRAWKAARKRQGKGIGSPRRGLPSQRRTKEHWSTQGYHLL